MIINSESHHGVDEEPFENAGAAGRPDTDRWASAEGPKQKT